MHLYIILSLLLLLSIVIGSPVYDAIVIGAGISGIAASKSLTEQKINHVIVQSRDRIGGRIVSGQVDGMQVDLGASFVHNPLNSNSIDDLIKQLNWKTMPAKTYLVEEYVLNGETLGNKQTLQYVALFKDLQSFIGQYIKSLSNDIDLQSTWQAFYNQKHSQYPADILNRAYYQLQMEAALNGADLNQVSTRYYVSNSEVGLNDYLPVGGYQTLLKALYKQCCSKVPIFFNTFITAIDYGEDIIKMTTSNQKMFYARKVICSIPLGVLKRGAVKFYPPLPTRYSQAIDSIGVGVYNKVIISLSDYFWTKNIKVLDFVATKQQNNKYQECYVLSTSPQLNMLMFFLSGTKAEEVNYLSDHQIVADLLKNIKRYLNSTNINFTVRNYAVTRWETDKNSLGSYSYYAVGTSKKHFQQLSKPIKNRLWFVGEHTHPNKSSNVHGAYDTGLSKGLEAAYSLHQSFKQSLVVTFVFVIISIF